MQGGNYCLQEGGKETTMDERLCRKIEGTRNWTSNVTAVTMKAILPR